MEKISVYTVIAYKVAINIARIIIGSLILFFGANIKEAAFQLWGNTFARDTLSLFLVYITRNIKDTPTYLTIMLALALIIFSLIELFFIVKLIMHRRVGAIGLLILSVLWTFVEILFVSRFLAIHFFTGMLINLAIILLLLKILRDWHNETHKPSKIKIRKIKRY